MSLLAKIIVLVLVITAICLIMSMIMRMRKQKDSMNGSVDLEPLDDNSYLDTDEIITVRKYNPEDESLIPADETVSMIATEPEQEELLIVNILAKETHQFVGYELLQALLAAGLRFGEMDIFHRHKELSGKGPVLFSLANLTEPGTFDLQKMGGVSSQGLTLFLRLSKHPEIDIERFELLIQTANQLCEDLGGKLQDERRKSFTKHTLGKYKQRIQAQAATVSADDEVVAI